MQQKPTAPHPVSMNLTDVYYVLFRRKWTVVLFSAVGILAALAVYLTRPALYQSEAKLFIRYVLDSKSVSSSGNDPQGKSSDQVRSPDSRGENIINSEVEILTSLDLAEQ